MNKDINEQKHQNTFKEVFSDIEINRAIRILGYLEKSLSLEDKLVLYIAGSTYRKNMILIILKINVLLKLYKIKALEQELKKFFLFQCLPLLSLKYSIQHH